MPKSTPIIPQITQPIPRRHSEYVAQTMQGPHTSNPRAPDLTPAVPGQVENKAPKKKWSKTSQKNIPTAKGMKKIGLMTKMFAIFPMVCLFLECLKSKIISASVQTMVVEIIDWFIGSAGPQMQPRCKSRRKGSGSRANLDFCWRSHSRDALSIMFHHVRPSFLSSLSSDWQTFKSWYSIFYGQKWKCQYGLLYMV